jgi:hypothetical protein
MSVTFGLGRNAGGTSKPVHVGDWTIVHVLQQANEDGLGILLRMNDLYGDTRYEVHELEELLSGLQAVATANTDPHVRGVAASMGDVVQEAIRLGKPIEVYGD